ncbi:MAG: tRNA (adenosine(37)-N6)-threonylcarbamoyltransferase complex dimerization subunit type 1 TsaB [Bacillota bacterium]|jgi:tRNA threonylcarbamoyladenosine biosynthesis protein TsaB
MLWLAVESATLVASVAVGKGDRILSEVNSHSSLTHSERLLPMIDQALALAGAELSGMQRLVVSSGPGSFTGLRIGLATVKGLGHALGLPILSVSTLEALAWQQSPADENLIVPLLDARRQQVYAAAYQRRTAGLATVQPPQAVALRDLLSTLQGKVLFVGEGAIIYRSQIAECLPEARFASPLHNWPRAASLALLAACDQRSPVTVEQLHPLYLRASSAEQKLQRQGKE